MQVNYYYRCLEGHGVISTDPYLDEQPCTARYSTSTCQGFLDGPYMDIYILLHRMSQEEDKKIRELGSQLQELLDIKFV